MLQFVGKDLDNDSRNGKLASTINHQNEIRSGRIGRLFSLRPNLFGTIPVHAQSQTILGCGRPLPLGNAHGDWQDRVSVVADHLVSVCQPVRWQIGLLHPNRSGNESRGGRTGNRPVVSSRATRDANSETARTTKRGSTRQEETPQGHQTRHGTHPHARGRRGKRGTRTLFVQPEKHVYSRTRHERERPRGRRRGLPEHDGQLGRGTLAPESGKHRNLQLF
mmetsp:Transcript_8985/g.22242  ORF Transcript_8985/g.22242 Transcript_8985/m.22242 type:complete len:221 (-) Transcript_8985:1920-2582(-)